MRIVVRSCISVAQRGVDGLLGRGVDGRGGVVEHQHPRVGEDGPGQGHALALPARERHAPLADHRVVRLGQRVDEPVRRRDAAAAASISASVASGRP